MYNLSPVEGGTTDFQKYNSNFLRQGFQSVIHPEPLIERSHKTCIKVPRQHT